MRSLLRVTILAALWAAVAASGTQQGAQQPPPQPYPQEGYGEPGVFFCTDLEGPSTRGSLCFADPDRCEGERQDARADGLGAAPCRAQTPVSCFQRGGDPDPSSTVCAAAPDDCDLWRLIDQDKTGRAGPPCEWRHAGARS